MFDLNCVRDTLSVMTLDPQLEQLLHNVLQQNNGNNGMVLEPSLAESLFGALRDSAREMEDQGLPAVLVVSPGIRPWMSRVVRYRVNELTVMSYSEIPDDQSVKVISTVQAGPRNANAAPKG